MNSVADLPKHSDDAHIARVLQLQVVEAVPEMAVERFANVVEDRILIVWATFLLKLEKGIQQQFVRQLLIIGFEKSPGSDMYTEALPSCQRHRQSASDLWPAPHRRR